MLHISFSNLLLLKVSRSSMYLIVSLNFLATQVIFHQIFPIRVLLMKKEQVCQLGCTIRSHRNANSLSIHLGSKTRSCSIHCSTTTCSVKYYLLQLSIISQWSR